MHLINEALNKRRRALFVADRITLIGLTSVTAESTAEVPREITLYEHPMAARSQDDINNWTICARSMFRRQSSLY